MTCPNLTPDGPFLTGMLGYVDCQAQTLGASGYQALAAPGSTASILLTAVLTLFVALFGYRMLFGQTPTARDGTIAMIKVGFVLALATSWSSYRTLTYDLVLHGPAELAAQVATPLPGAGGGLVARLQGVDDALVELQLLGTGKPVDAGAPTDTPLQLTPQQQQQAFQRLQTQPRWDPAKDATLLGQSRTLYLTGAIGAFSSVRLVAGLLLALGPLFALLLLFDATRGVFEGWVRALGGAALGALSTSILLGVELALVEPWLAAILDNRRADISTPAVPVELLVVALVFVLTLLAGLIASAKVAHGFRFPEVLREVPQRMVDGWRMIEQRSLGSVVPVMGTGTPERVRAQAISDAAAAAQRRERATPPLPTLQLVERDSGGQPASQRGSEQSWATPIGQSARRRTTGRVSARANRRDTM